MVKKFSAFGAAVEVGPAGFEPAPNDYASHSSFRCPALGQVICQKGERKRQPLPQPRPDGILDIVLENIQ